MNLNIDLIKSHPAAQDSIKAGNYWQAILDVGYHYWQQADDWRYRNMIDNAEKELGKYGAFFILLGKYNQQVCNGGHVQYFDNGYADGEGSCFSRHDIDCPLHWQLVELYKQYGLQDLVAHGKTVLDILKAFKVEVDDRRTITYTCDECGGSGIISEFCECDGEKPDCECCAGTGHIKETCPDCDGDGETEGDNPERGSICNVYHLGELDTRYYNINEEFESAVDAHVKELFTK